MQRSGALAQASAAAVKHQLARVILGRMVGSLGSAVIDGGNPVGKSNAYGMLWQNQIFALAILLLWGCARGPSLETEQTKGQPLSNSPEVADACLIATTGQIAMEYLCLRKPLRQ